MEQSAVELNLLFVLVPAGVLAIVAGLLRLFPQVWTRTVRDEDARRNHTVDGARGLLSLWVLTHHLNTVPFFLQPRGDWRPEQGAVVLLMSSSFFVAPFYALTGMLFGGALLASRGELDGWRFLRNRLLRLAPVYALSVLLIVAVAFWMTGFELRVPLWKLAKQIARWSSFGFLPMYDINGAPVAGWHRMLWTLPYEIIFYLALPVLAWGQRRFRTPLALIGGLALAAVFSWPFIYFAAGVIAAAALGWRGRLAPAIWSALCMAAVIGLGASAGWSGPVAQAALLVPILAAAALQVPPLAPLRARSIRFVGEISYSLYILHFPVICILFSLAVDARTLNALGFLPRMGALALLGSAIVSLAALSYVFVERPVIAWSKRPSRRARRFGAEEPIRNADPVGA